MTVFLIFPGADSNRGESSNCMACGSSNPRQFAAREGEQFFLTDFAASSNRNLSQLRIGSGYDDALSDRRVRQHRRFYFERGDVLAAGNDVPLAATILDAAISVPHCHVINVSPRPLTSPTGEVRVRCCYGQHRNSQNGGQLRRTLQHRGKNYSRFEGGKKYSVVIILMSMDALCDGRDADGSLGICAEWL
ncbi:MAG TPA: hypothetical protein VGM27_33010 [Acidobacteriaceae bacterium]